MTGARAAHSALASFALPWIVRWSRASGGVNRGVAYWSDGKPNGERRIFLGLGDARLISLDAKTGKPDEAFGGTGELDLRAALDATIAKRSYGSTSAPMVYRDLVILGFSNDETSPSAPGSALLTHRRPSNASTHDTKVGNASSRAP